MFIRIVTFNFFLLIYDAHGWSTPCAHLFNESYFKGYISTIFTSKENLAGTSLAARIASAEVNGVWAFFRFPNFNQDKDPFLSYILWGDGAQTGHLGSLANTVESIRLLGGVEDVVPNLRIFDGSYFTGAETILFKSSPTMHYQHTSLILKNCEAWTIYSEVNFGGMSLCLHPSDHSETCSPWFFFDEKDYKLPSIRSVRKGCHSHNKVLQDV